MRNDDLIKTFIDYLVSTGVSKNSLKFYKSDIVNFLKFVGDMNQINHDSVFAYLKTIKKTNSPKTYNRKLSTLRKFIGFSLDLKLMDTNPMSDIKNVFDPSKLLDKKRKTIEKFDRFLINQKISKNTRKVYLSDIEKFINWQEKTEGGVKQYLNENQNTVSRASYNRLLASLKKFYEFKEEKFPQSRFVFPKLAPYRFIQEAILQKLENRKRLQKVFEHIFLTRPKWYRRYHTYPIASYVHFAILFLFCAISGYAVYDNVIIKTQTSLAYPATPETPNKFLSFQGRLTDELGNPITGATNVVFKLYSVSSGGSALWDSTACSITPDSDGIFSTLLGSSCGGAIDSSVFSENADIWLGVTVGGDSEATPRIQIATVAYALNSETLQGFPLGTGVSTVPYIDSTGKLTIASASPTIESSSGIFGIIGQATTISTANTTNGVITVNPDGTGTLDLIFEGASAGGSANGFVNATNASITSGALYGGTVASAASGYNFIDFQAGVSPASVFSVGATGLTTVGADLYVSSGISLYNNAVSDDTIEAAKFCTGDGESNCVTDFSSLASGASIWTDGGAYIYPTNSETLGNSTTGEANKIAGLYLADSAPLTLGTDNDVSLAFSGTTLAITQGDNDLNFDSDTLFIDGSANNVGIGTTEPGAKLQINTGATTTIGQIIKAAASQTANLTEWQNSSGTVKAAIDVNGSLGLGITPSADARLYVYATPTGTSGTKYGTLSLMAYSPSSPTSATTYGFLGSGTLAGSANMTSTQFGASFNHDLATSGGTISYLVSGRFSIKAYSASNTVTNYTGLYSKIDASTSYGLTISTARLIDIGEVVATGTLAITDYTGLYIRDITSGSSTNYAIYTGLGDVRFGDEVVIASPTATALTIGAGTADIDYQLKFDGETNDGVLTWMEDEDYFQFADKVLLDDALYFTQTDGNEYIDSLADGYLDLAATTGVRLTSPLTSATGDFAIGGTTLAASMFGIDESAGNFYLGYDNSANPTLNFEATDGDAGEFGFNTNDAFYITNSKLGIGDTSPDHTLDVTGNIGLDASGYINWGDTDSESGYGVRDNAGTLEYKNSGGSWAGIGSGGSSSWTDGGTYLYPTDGEVLGNSTTGEANKIAGLYLTDSAPLTFGTDNDVSFAFSDTTLAITQGNNDINFDSDTLFIDGSANNVGIGTTAPDAKLDIQGSLTEATYGSNLVTNGDFATGDFTGWTAGANWSVSSNAALHTAGSTATLYQNISVTNGTTYQIEWTDTGTAGSYTFSIGSVTSRTYYYWESAGSKRTTIVASGTSSQAFTITPSSDYNGSLDNITVRAITAYPSSVANILNSDGTTGISFRAGGTGLDNTFIGYGSGVSNTIGYYNSAMGRGAIYSNTTGYYNSAMGRGAIYSNTTGYYNSAMGVNALYSNTTGYINTALGVNALYSNTTGSNNSAVGTYALFSNTTGYHNSAVGTYALYNNTTGYQNSAVGVNAGRYISGGAVANTTSDYSIYLGHSTKALADNDQNEIVIGYNATGLGSNTVVLGNDSITTTALKGNVGIGTTAPDAALEINHATGDNLRLTYNDADGSATAYTDFSLASDGDLTINSAGGEIDFSGDDISNVGTLTATTGILVENLQVNNSVAVSYNRFGTNTTSHVGNITDGDDLLISSDLELDGVLYLDGANISNSEGTAFISFASNNLYLNSTNDITILEDPTIQLSGTNPEISTTGSSLVLDIAGTDELTLTASALSPSTSDSNALGTTTNMWSDLFLASGGVVNFDNGDVTLTHSANALAMAGGQLSVAGINTEVTYGSDLVTNGDFATGDFTGWTAGANWSVVSNAALHTAGSTATLYQNIAVTSGTTYQIEWTDTGATDGYYRFSIGSAYSRYYAYNESASAKRTTITATATGSLTFSINPSSTYDGSFDDITVKAITSSPLGVITVRNEDSTVGLEIRSGGTGLNNTFIGLNSGDSNTSGFDNTSLGSLSLSGNTTGYNNIAVGKSALSANTTGYSNIAVGANVLTLNTEGYKNIGIGANALSNNTAGTKNTAIGINALYANTTGYYNTAIGNDTLYANTYGNWNTALGESALYTSTDGISNTALGAKTLYDTTDGDYNTAVGCFALENNTVGMYNTALGANAGRYITGGSTANATSDYGVYIGYNSKALADDGTNEIVIGNDATGLGSNTVVLGNDNITTTALKGNVGIGTASPATKLDVITDDATNDGITNVLTLTHTTSGTAAGGSSDSYTKALLHMDGADASSTFTDDTGKTWTAVGNAQLDTAQSKFGGSSGLFDGSGNECVETVDNDDFDVGSGDFTVDFWVRRNVAATSYYVFGQMDSTPTASTISMRCYFISNTLTCNSYSGSTGYTVESTTSMSSTSTWYHVAFVRDSDTIRLFINGTQEDTVNVTGVTINNSAYKFAIGRGGEYALSPMNGWIDEFRFSKGTARWTSAFTPPSSAHTYNTNTGIGTGLLFKSEDAAGNAEDAARIAGTLVTATDGSEDSSIVFETRSGGGALSRAMRLWHTGDLTISGWLSQDSNPDVAENVIVTDPSITAGDVVMLDPEFNNSGQDIYNRAAVKKADTPYSSAILGVISTDPGIILNAPESGIDNQKRSEDNERPLTLTGRVPVNIDPDSPPFEPGDFLTASDKPGLATKATQAGYIIGKAMQSWPLEETDNSQALVFIQPGYHNPDVFLNKEGYIYNPDDVNIASEEHKNYKLSFTEIAGNIIKKIGIFKKVETNLITPIADTDLIIDLDPENASSSAKLAIKGVDDEIVTLINAEGKITSNALETKEATISGTLYANDIKSEKLEEIEKILHEVESNQKLLADADNWETDTDGNPNILSEYGEIDTIDIFATGTIAGNSVLASISLNIGNDFILNDNSINTFINPLKIQSLAVAGIEIMSGKIVIDTQGNMTINGNLDVAGNVATQKILIANSEEEVLIASQSAEIKTNATAGKGILPAGKDNIKISNQNITEDTLIYITPLSDTHNNVLYVKSKEDGEFTVGFNNFLEEDIEFNWWVIDLKEKNM